MDLIETVIACAICGYEKNKEDVCDCGRRMWKEMSISNQLKIQNSYK